MATEKTEKTEDQKTEAHAGHSIPAARTEGLPALPPLEGPPEAPPPAQPQPGVRTLAVIDQELTVELTAALEDEVHRIEHFKNAGRLYKEAEDRVTAEGTTFEVWFNSHPRGHSIRTAYRWMQLNKYWGLVGPKLRELTPGTEANYRVLVKEAKAEAQRRAGKPPPKAKAKWALEFDNVKNGLLKARKEHNSLKTAEDIFNFLKTLDLPQKVWKKLEE